MTWREMQAREEQDEFILGMARIVRIAMVQRKIARVQNAILSGKISTDRATRIRQSWIDYKQRKFFEAAGIPWRRAER